MLLLEVYDWSHWPHTSGNFGKGRVVGLAGKQGRVPIKGRFNIAEFLQENGYKTGMMGKWGLGEPNTSGEPNLEGFDTMAFTTKGGLSHTIQIIWENTVK